jgi:integron integrase
MKPTKSPLINELRNTLRFHHKAERTIESYEGWVRRFVKFHGTRHPRELGEPEIRDFLTWLAAMKKCSASTQNQALSALLFLYGKVLRMELGDFSQFERAKLPRRIPVVLSKEEVDRVLALLRQGLPALALRLIYGCGLRVSECVRLRMKDVDFDRRQILVRDAKGGKDRMVPMPESLVGELERAAARTRVLHAQDRAEGYGWVHLPGNFAAKSPQAEYELVWQYFFAAAGRSRCPVTGRTEGRYHLMDETLRGALVGAVRRAGITKRVVVHTLRHSYATHLLEAGEHIESVRDLLGHKDVSTTMIYLHVMTRANYVSPLDRLRRSDAPLNFKTTLRRQNPGGGGVGGENPEQ